MEVTHRVQHEEVKAGAGAEGHQGGAAVQSVAGTHNVVARLESVFVCRLLFCGLKAATSRAGEKTDRQAVSKTPQKVFFLTWWLKEAENIRTKHPRCVKTKNTHRFVSFFC